MKVSARTTYALQALIDMALHSDGPGTRLTTHDIALRQQVPERFLEQQITLLRNAGFVISQRGAAGGCALARRPQDIKVRDVVDALEGAVALDVGNSAQNAPGQAVRELWHRLDDVQRAALADVTVADLAARETELGERAALMFYL